ncbi:MAG TPA: BTAD domain-containing putative transcriptional regulator [Acidimicrobiales bacterium]|nr:BTAD domain-containing putative transcriptional regulator [Acidimicrobiales bacterium]
MVKFKILGTVEAWAGEQRLALGGPRQIALLAALLLQANRAVSSDTLIEDVWGPSRRGAAKRLSVAVARLRQALEPLDEPDGPVLQTVSGGYLMSISSGDIDTHEFDTLVEVGLRAMSEGRAATAAEKLRAALGLWRGPALADVRFHNFAQAEIRRVEELQQLAVETRIDADLQLGAGPTLIGELRALVGLHPAREHFAGQLMLALYHAGRQVEALEVYQQIRTHLRTELGLEPGPALRSLEAQILEQAPSIGEGWPGFAAVHSGHDGPSDVVTIVVTVLDTDSAGSSGVGGSYGELVGHLRDLLRQVWDEAEEPQLAECEDGLLGVFGSPRAALLAARAARDASAASHLMRRRSIGVRIGVHTGRLRTRNGVHWGPDVGYTLRLADAANAGQVLVSRATAVVLPEAALVDLGEYQLPDFPVPSRLFALSSGPHTRPRTGNPLRSNLPSAHGELIGRDAERAELLTMLETGRNRLVTITGPGGSGKTSLALAVAETVVRDLAESVFFISLAEITGDSFLATVATALGVHLRSGADALEAVGTAIAGRRMLIVLDNFEHLLDSAPLVGELLTRTRELRVVVTSQAPLRIRDERVVALGPLELPDDDDRATVAAAPASRLLVERTREADPDFQLTDQNVGSIAHLCRALGGLPLAIELAAARLTLLSPQGLLDRLDEGIEAIGHGARDLPARQRGLRAALDWTHRLLNEDQARLLREMGIFAGPVPLERIERVCARGVDQLDDLARLVDLSLVNRAGDGRFLLHAGVRSYAREKLVTAGETDDLKRRHCESLADAAEVWGRRFLLNVGEVQSAVLGEEADISQALSWAASTDPGSFARIAGGVSMVLMFSARLPPWADAIERTLAETEVDRSIQPWLLLAASLVAFEHKDLELGRLRLSATVGAAEMTGDPYLVCLMRICSIVFNVLGATSADVREEYESLTRPLSDLGDPELARLADGLEPYVLAYYEGRHVDAGLRWSALMADPTRTDFAGWTALFCWPDSALLNGDYESALDGYRDALRGARERSQSPTVAYQVEGIAMALAGLGRHEEAIEASGWADVVRQTAGPALNSWYQEKVEASLRTSWAATGNEKASAAYARGRSLPLDSAVSAGLRVVSSRPSPETLLERRPPDEGSAEKS